MPQLFDMQSSRIVSTSEGAGILPSATSHCLRNRPSSSSEDDMPELADFLHGIELQRIQKFNPGNIFDVFNHPDVLAQTAWILVHDQTKLPLSVQQLRLRTVLHGATFGSHRHRLGPENSQNHKCYVVSKTKTLLAR